MFVGYGINAPASGTTTPASTQGKGHAQNDPPARQRADAVRRTGIRTTRWTYRFSRGAARPALLIHTDELAMRSGSGASSWSGVFDRLGWREDAWRHRIAKRRGGSACRGGEPGHVV